MAAIKEYSYGGNYIKAIDPYNCFMDMTVAPSQLHIDGAFFGWNEIVHVKLRRMLQTLDSQKTTHAREVRVQLGATTDMDSAMHYCVPEINPFLKLGTTSMIGQTHWGKWMNLPGTNRNTIAYKDTYMVTHFLSCCAFWTLALLVISRRSSMQSLSTGSGLCTWKK